MLPELLPASSLVLRDPKESSNSSDEEKTTAPALPEIQDKEKVTFSSQHLQHHHLMAMYQQQQKCIDAIQSLVYCVVLQSTIISSKLPLKSIRALPRLEDLRLIVISAVPYLAFLFSFAINLYVRILPTADDVQCVKLYNVSRWESLLWPWSINRAIASLEHPLLDLLAALPYLAHYALPVAYPVYLYLSNRLDLVSQFYRLIGWSMWFHYVIWFFLPTFPPWAVNSSISGSQNFNVTPVLTMSQREGRAFARVDQLIQWPLFHGLFSGNPVPFASFPSGHVAWPTCVLLTLPPGGPIACGLYMMLVSWATMYSDHHYMLDALAAIVVVLLTQKLINRTVKTQPITSELPF